MGGLYGEGVSFRGHESDVWDVKESLERTVPPNEEDVPDLPCHLSQQLLAAVILLRKRRVRIATK